MRRKKQVVRKPMVLPEDNRVGRTIKDTSQENLAIVKLRHLETHCVGCPNFKQAFLTEGVVEGGQVIMCDPLLKPPRSRLRSKSIEKPNCKKFGKPWHSVGWKPTANKFFRNSKKKA